MSGDSLRRQQHLRDDYCQRRGWTLDTSLTVKDLGVSAFRGKNALVGNLGVFLRAIQEHKVPVGSALIVENLDRISRWGIDEGYDIIKKILKAGITLVTLTPEREYTAESLRGLTKGALEIQVILERAAEESERRSERVGRAWREKRKAAREGRCQPPRRKDGRITDYLTSRLPGWVRDHGGKLEAIPEHAATVKLIFHLAASGYGQTAIVKKLTALEVPTFLGTVRRRNKDNPDQVTEKPGTWNRTYVKILLNDRRVLGELQLKNGDGSKDGAPLKGYFPAVIHEDEWYAARDACTRRDRKKGPTRLGKHANLFSGLLTDALSGSSMMATTRMDKGRCWRLVVNTTAAAGQASCRSFPLPVLEEAILSCLEEVDPRSLGADQEEPDRIAPLEGRLADLKDRIDQLTEELLTGSIPAIAAALRTLEGDKQEVEAELEAARALGVRPLSEAWGEAKSLSEALTSAPDPRDARLRLRSALRRIVEGMWLVIVPRKRNRLCAVQMVFRGTGRTRSYLIYYQAPRGNQHAETKPGSWWVRSLSSVAKPGDLDLRKPAHAQRLEAALAAAKLEAAD
jgi:DNA invertase Pin-like site-specific DNA recombinase